MRRLIVIGVALHGDGYPNAARTIELLRKSAAWDVIDIASWLPQDTRLWQLVSAGFLQKVKLLWMLCVGGLWQAVRALLLVRKGDLVYVPYPAPPTLWWLSLIPSAWRPRCIVDAYISLWDSMFQDRSAAEAGTAASKMLRAFEARSFRAASLVLVDTEENRRQFIDFFKLDNRCIKSIPLAVNCAPFLASSSKEKREPERIRVLFFGTLAPLHGVDVILRAACILAKEKWIEFRLVGDGQQREMVERFLVQNPGIEFTWVCRWLTLEQISAEVRDAHICLGVFGGGGKAARVLPFKLYYTLAAGKAIITQANYSLPAGAPLLPVGLVEGRSVEDRAQNLAKAIRSLALNNGLRSSLGRDAAEYFAMYLSDQVVLESWNRLPL